MNAEDPVAAYRAACARYTRAVLSARDSRDEAEERYRNSVAVVRQHAEQTVASRDAAAREAAEAKQLVAETDEACTDIWRRLGAYIGVKKLGVAPPPGAARGADSVDEIRDVVESTRRTIALAQRGELPFDPPKHATPLAVAVGVLVGVIAAVAAGALLSTADRGDHANALIQAGALVMVFGGAFAGVPVVAGWLSVRHRISVRPVHVGACVAGATVAMCGLAPWLLTG
ncbi:MAG: hypothetical protein ACRDXX_07495 [Stackebrandtia sp.]